VFAVDNARHSFVGEERRLSALRDQVLERVLLRQLQLVGGERRAQRDVGHQLQNFVVELREGGSGNGRVVGTRARAERRADARHFVGDAAARARLGALVEHAGQDVGQAGQRGRVVRVAGAKGEPVGDERQPRVSRRRRRAKPFASVVSSGAGRFKGRGASGAGGSRRKVSSWVSGIMVQRNDEVGTMNDEL
jgi:hypothetical protein